MNLARKMARHPRNRERTIKKGTPYRRLILVEGRAVHATKGRSHPASVLDYRLKLILDRVRQNG